MKDEYDQKFKHIVIRDRRHRKVVGYFRYTFYSIWLAYVQAGYSAAHYDLRALERFDKPVLEVGRVCTDPFYNDPDILTISLGLFGPVC